MILIIPERTIKLILKVNFNYCFAINILFITKLHTFCEFFIFIIQDYH